MYMYIVFIWANKMEIFSSLYTQIMKNCDLVKEITTGGEVGYELLEPHQAEQTRVGKLMDGSLSFS